MKTLVPGSPINLLECWEIALAAVQPVNLLPVANPPGDALLCWGKAADATFEALGRPRVPSLILQAGQAKKAGAEETRLNRVVGEHPLPGHGSLKAGARLLEFFGTLGRLKTRRLEIHLSGGASSCAWVPPWGLTPEHLTQELRRLYSKPLTIRELNEKRDRLCRLKQGGAGRWLRKFAPHLVPTVWLISDVFPFGPEVVGSGPFADGRIRHRVLADNQVLVRSFSRELRRRGVAILESRSGQIGTWQQWTQELSAQAKEVLKAGKKGAILWGGEPRVRLPAQRGRGGRMTLLATALSLELLPWIEKGKLQILTVSSDGNDGTSDAAGAWVHSAILRQASSARHALLFERALKDFNPAEALQKIRGLVTRADFGTNVQDCAVILVNG